ncbi:MAG: aminotransferase class V-fold PLP-dependent enzyme [Firmicutes bacterium]|nr:aminotransferase class V-fold PLP-dependent enzyme [Bacillota bacterium]
MAVDLGVVGLDVYVPTRRGYRRPYINLDNAASTPPLVAVARKVEEFLPWYASVHRGAGFKSRLATEIFEEARRIVVASFGFSPATNVAIFVKNATEALNKLAHRWPWEAGDIVISSLAEHHSNDLPWRKKARVLRLGLRPDGSLDLDHLASLLAAHAPRVKLVAITGASNVTGVLPDIHQAAILAHRYGAKIVVDAAQLAGHRPIFAFPDDDPRHLDFMALSGHKIYAPFGQGALIGPRSFFARGDPEYAGGGTVSFVTPESVAWALPPARDEAGTPNTIGAVAMAVALKTLQAADLSRLARREYGLTKRLYGGLARIPGVVLYGPPFPTVDRIGIVSFNLAGLPHGLVAAVLACDYAIGVRSGCFCAHPYVAWLLGTGGTTPPPGPERPGMVRVSLGLYNTEEDVDRLLHAIAEIAAESGYYRRCYEYEEGEGIWWPRGWRPEWGKWFRL